MPPVSSPVRRGTPEAEVEPTEADIEARRVALPGVIHALVPQHELVVALVTDEIRVGDRQRVEEAKHNQAVPRVVVVHELVADDVVGERQGVGGPQRFASHGAQ